MRQVLALVVVAALSTACAYTNPAQPAPTTIDLSLPSTLTISASAGTVTARVQNANGAPLANLVVAFTTSAGSISPSMVTTSPDGRAVTTLTANDTATVTATSGTLSTHWLVAPQAPGTGTTTPPGSTPTPAPAAAFLNVSSSGSTGSPLTFSVSSSASGPWSWSFGDGVNTQTSTFSTSHAYGRAGVYVASVSGSGTSTGSATITVTDPAPTTGPVAPTLSVTLNCTPGAHAAADTTCNVSETFNNATISGGAVTNVTWDWGDGTTADNAGGTVPVKNHRYTNPGTYTVVAVVTANTPSNGSQTGTATKSVIVP
jgi:PKD repeat protein